MSFGGQFVPLTENGRNIAVYLMLCSLETEALFFSLWENVWARIKDMAEMLACIVETCYDVLSILRIRWSLDGYPLG